MRKKKPHVAMLSEVTITRQGDSATIKFKDPEITATQLRIGLPHGGSIINEIRGWLR